MSRLNLNRQVFDKNKFKSTVDTSFTQLKNPVSETPQEEGGNVEEFFILYSNLFYQIPKFGESNSHEFLIKESSNYINFSLISEDIKALTEEINSLREENLRLLQQNITLITQVANNNG
jgi:hypothetical protein